MKDKWSKKPSNYQEEQCLSYIREYPILGRVLEKFILKYESYGDVVGRISISRVSEVEREILEGFFQKNYHGKKQIGISAKDLSKALQNSRFSEISAQRLLEVYAKTELYSKAEIKQQELEKWQCTFQEMKQNYTGTCAKEWLDAVELEKEYGYLFLQGVYRESGVEMAAVKQALHLGCQIVNRLPIRSEEQEYLAVFATQITGNPHAFDEKNPLGKYLLQILQWELANSDKGMDNELRKEFRSLEKQRLYLNSGILRDDISNYVVVSGVRAITKNGRSHKGMEGFVVEENSVQVPLSVLTTWEKVICPDNQLYIVENPSVYAFLVNKWGCKKALFCMNGQPKLSSLVFLDLLEHEKVQVYYWGDFDPEGLLIAQKVKEYYLGAFSYWNMSLADYRAAQSNEVISAKRLASLKLIKDKELEEVVLEMQRCQKAGYQERVMII